MDEFYWLLSGIALSVQRLEASRELLAKLAGVASVLTGVLGSTALTVFAFGYPWVKSQYCQDRSNWNSFCNHLFYSADLLYSLDNFGCMEIKTRRS